MFKSFAISFLLFSLFLSLQANQQIVVTDDGPVCPPTAKYTFNLLTLFWPPQFCQNEEGQCHDNWQEGWSGTLATIHGYWPSSAESSYLDCFGYNGDPNCEGFPYRENITANQTQLQKDLEIYWPEISQKTSDGWYSHEWNKHGTCYLMNFIEDNMNAYEKDELAFNETIYVSYFSDTVDKAKTLNVNLKSGTKYENKQQIANDIGLKASQFRVKCYGDDELNEIQICYNRSEKPGKEVLIDCPPELPFRPDDVMEIDCYEKPFFIV